MIKISKNLFILFFLLILIPTLTFTRNVKKTITIEDAKLWRQNKVTLSDNGMWYTVLYSLTEKPAQDKNKTSAKNNTKKDEQKKKDIALYGKGALTDVLYIRNAGSKKEYQIPKGSNPLFSPTSDWIAYSIKIKSDKKIKKSAEKKDKKEANKIITLQNLNTGETKKWRSNASYKFTQKGDYFISFDKSSLLLVNLSTLQEYYIGNISEFLLPKRSNLIAYIIGTSDKRGNGIYIYDLKKQTTRAMDTGNFDYSNLSWNKDETAIAAFKYKWGEKNQDSKDIRITVFKNINSDKPIVNEISSKNIKGFQDDRIFAVKKDREKNKLIWSKDCNLLFLNIKKKTIDKTDNNKSKVESTVNVWHWKDKKLVSQQMVESNRKKDKTFRAVLDLKNRKIFQLTHKKIQEIFYSLDTDKWAVGTDNRAYISDWDVERNDLYRIDLHSGEKKLIVKNYTGRINISPDGEKVALWRNGHYWIYIFTDSRLINITENVPVSFQNVDYDYYGLNPDYGFVGWVNGNNSIIVNHKLDLWQLAFDDTRKAVNLTKKIRGNEQIRFRFEDIRLSRKPKMKDRYIDLTSPNLLTAFNIKTKYAGYYQLSKDHFKKLIFKPASYSTSRWRSGLIRAKKSKTLIFRMGNYQEYPEAYLTDTDFSKIIKISRTNPQQSDYKWGHRILINYTNDDGVPLQGVLSIPDSYKKGQKLPMIVYSYEKLSNNMYRYSQPRISGIGMSEMMYVSDGYLFLQPDIYFHVGTPHSDMHECIDSAVSKVIELGFVDKKAIGYDGFSFGGHCGMYISTQKNKFTAIAAGAGVSNLVQGFNIDIVHDGSNEQDYYMTQQGRLGASPADKLEIYLRESAVFNAKNMNTPLLLYHGTADSVVRWEHSYGLYSILRFLKKPVILLSYRGEGHGLRKKENRIDITTRLKEYFDHYLKGKKAAVWITDGLPPRLKKEKNKRTVPIWK